MVIGRRRRADTKAEHLVAIVDQALRNPCWTLDHRVSEHVLSFVSNLDAVFALQDAEKGRPLALRVA